jgi:hypothetical protein
MTKNDLQDRRHQVATILVNDPDDVEEGRIRGAGRGRGEYYKNLYGRGGRGGHGPRQGEAEAESDSARTNGDLLSRGPVPLGRIIGTRDVLEQELRRLDGKSYGAYKDLKGNHHRPS